MERHALGRRNLAVTAKAFVPLDGTIGIPSKEHETSSDLVT